MERYIPKQRLGNKGFGDSYLVKDKVTGDECVLKQIDISKMLDSEYDRDIMFSSIVRRFGHPNIVSYRAGFVDKEKRLYIFVSDYCKSKLIIKLRCDLHF